MKPSAPCYELVKTPFGEGGIVWVCSSGFPRVIRILLPARAGKVLQEIRTLFPGASTKSCGAVEMLGKGLLAFTEGAAVSFDTSVLDMGRVPPYHRKVLRALTGIPRGKVRSYATIASITGAPGGARASGQGCAKNPFPIVFPCHRVIRADGSLGGFGGGLPLKRALLKIEGIQFDKGGKVLPEFILR